LVEFIHGENAIDVARVVPEQDTAKCSETAHDDTHERDRSLCSSAKDAWSSD
jgi:hypothetical protein